MSEVQAALPAAQGGSNRNDLRMGVFILGSVVLLTLGAMFAIYAHLAEVTEAWPPPKADLNNYAAVMITITLLMASATGEWAARSTKDNDRSVLTGLTMTFIFGLCVINGLLYTINGLTFGIASHSYGSIFYSLMSVSVANIAIASAIILGMAIRSLNGVTGADFSRRVRTSVTYWHFTVACWLLVFFVVYMNR